MRTLLLYLPYRSLLIRSNNNENALAIELAVIFRSGLGPIRVEGSRKVTELAK
jgi:hypothetical protein